MIIDCISDLHGYYPTLEGGDLLIVAGDLLANETKNNMLQFLDWIYSAEYTKKIVVAGNHDNLVQEKVWNLAECKELTYLQDSGTEFDGLKIWGSPWSKWFKGIHPSCKAFTGTEREIDKKFALIPEDTDILVTHSPPYRMFDSIKNPFRGTENVGAVCLRTHSMKRVKPRLHVFGHIHEWGGNSIDLGSAIYVNASLVNEHYEPTHKAVRVIL